MRLSIIVLFAFFGVLRASSASAEALPPGGNLLHTGSPAYSTNLPSYVIHENLQSELVSTVTENLHAFGLGGTFTSQVYTNPSGGLTFVYQLFNGSPSLGVDCVTLGDIYGQVDWTNVGVRNAGANGLHSPDQIGRNDVLAYEEIVPADQTIEADWKVTSLLAGETSSQVWFETDATTWGMARAVGIESPGVANAGADYLGPSTVPEPTSVVSCLAALVCGVGCLAWKRRGTR